jgi:hypothetical protein
MKKNVCGISLIMERGVSHAPKESKRIGVVQGSGLLGIPERLAAWKSLTEDVLEFGVEVPLDV